MEGLRKFVLRAKVKIEDGGEVLSVAGLHGAHGLQSAGIAVPSNAGYAETDGIGVAAVNGDPSRYWVIGAAADSGGARTRRRRSSKPRQIERDWRLADIRAGLPQIYLSTREAFVAQMLNLDLLDGISFSKGCYTGTGNHRTHPAPGPHQAAPVSACACLRVTGTSAGRCT